MSHSTPERRIDWEFPPSCVRQERKPPARAPQHPHNHLLNVLGFEAQPNLQIYRSGDPIELKNIDLMLAIEKVYRSIEFRSARPLKA